jgi:hypothetical protein
MIKIVCKTNEYGSHHLQRPLWEGTWKPGKKSYGFPNLTPGKIYQADYIIKVNNDIGERENYRLTDDRGNTFLYPKSIFTTLDDFREERIQELLK